MTLNEMIKRLLGFLQPERRRVALVIVLGVAAALLESVGLYLFMPLVNAVATGSGALGALPIPVLQGLAASLTNQMQIAVFIGLILGCILLKNVVMYFCTVTWFDMQSRVVHDIRTRLFRQVLYSGADYAADSEQANVISTLASETWRVGDSVITISKFIVAAITCAIFTVLLFIISWQMTVFAVALMGVAAVIMLMMTRRAQKVGLMVMESNHQFAKRIWEAFGSVRTIRAYGREETEIAAFAKRSADIRHAGLHQEKLWAIPGRFGEVSATVVVATLIVFAGDLAGGVAPLVAFLAVLYRMQAPLREALGTRVHLMSAKATVEKVVAQLQATETPVLVNGVKPWSGLKQAIVFENVSFRYKPDEALVLQDVSLAIPAGKTTAIVGISGSGKSTLMDLIMRFRDPVEGRVLVDGDDLRDLDLAQWRQHLALMSQEVFLFDQSVRDNIRYGRLDATDADLRHAADVAYATGFIEQLPLGWDTPVGERGARLSGGQRQRIALARAVLRDPALLLLDEATNALDSFSERAFQESLAAFQKGRTLVVVAHRLSTVENADQIVMMEAGRIIETGDFHSLIARNGRFAHMYEAQRLSSWQA